MKKQAAHRQQGQITPKGEGKWLIRWYVGRVQCKRVYGSEVVHGTFKQAEKALTLKHAAKATGTLVEPSKVTLQEFAEQWMQSKHDIQSKTRHGYAERLTMDVYPLIGFLPLAKMTSERLQAFYDSLIRDRHLSPRTVRYTHAVLRQVFQRAVQWNKLAKNPCDFVTLPRIEREEPPTLTPAQLQHFLKVTEGSPRGLLWRVAFSTGMRPQEYLVLKWDDLERVTKDGELVWQFRIRRTLVEGEQRGRYVIRDFEAKTDESIRKVSITDTLAEALQKHKQTQNYAILKAGAKYERQGFLFTTRTGHWLEPFNVRRWWKEDLTAAGLPVVKLYSSRHTSISLLLASGASVKDVAERHGHSDPTMTLRVYAHAMPGADARLAKLTEKMFMEA